MKRPLYDLSVFVPQGKEEEYFLKHKIAFKKLKNGITLFGIPRIVNDTNDANLQFVFSSGSHNDPVGKKGIHHLFEHLLVNQIQKDPKSVDIYKNAYTNSRQIVVEAAGVANSKVKEYGLWPMLPTIVNSLKSPINNLTTDQIENEVKIVLQEIAERNTNPNFHAYKFIYKCLYDKKNPFCANTLGTEADLKSITTSDIQNIIDRVFVPKNMSIRVSSEGDVNLAKEVLEELEKNVTNFPRKDTSPLTVDVLLQEKINSQFKPGSIYTKNDGLKNNLIHINFAWIFPTLDFTAHCLSLTRFIPVLHDKLLSYSRLNGMGYSSYASSFGGISSRAVVISITLPKRSTPEQVKNEIFHGIKKHVIKKIDDKILKTINEKERLIQLAASITTNYRYSLLQTGFEYYNRIIDADLVKKEYQKITIDDLKDWRDKLLEVPPAVIITGDLS